MRLTVILLTCIAGIAYGNDYLQPRGRTKISPRSDLETPLLENVSSSPRSGAKGKVTAKGGPNHPAVMFMRESRYSFQSSQYKDVPRGKTDTLENSHPQKSVVGGWPRPGGQISTETTAKRVKIKMNPGTGIGTIDRLNKDGSWSQEVLSNKGQLTRWYKNEDDSRVTVKTNLMGGIRGGALKSTGKEYDQPNKKRKWS